MVLPFNPIEPNYFKQILELLYKHFGDLKYYSLENITSNISEEIKPEFNKLIEDLLYSEGFGFIETNETHDKNNASHQVYRLTIKGFNYCRMHKDYFDI